MTLLGSNTFSGLTTVSGGTLQVGNGGGSGSLGGSGVLDNGSLVFSRTGSLVFSPVINGNGSLAETTAGVLTLLGNNLFSGGTTISAGTIQLGNGGSSGGLLGNVAVAAGGALVLDRSDNASMAFSLSGPGSLVKIGGDTVTLTGNSSAFSGAISVSRASLPWPALSR